MARTIKDGDKVIAVIVELANLEKGVTWYGTKDDSLQFGSRKYRGEIGKEIKAHSHEMAVREIRRTQEAFVLVEGKMTVVLYGESGNKLQEIKLKPGDCCLFYAGGHGFKVYSDRLVAYEIKSGCYVNDSKEIVNETQN